MNSMPLLAAALAAVVLASPAAAVVYRGFQSAGPAASGTVTVETDGTFGVLAASNILSFAISSTIQGVDYDSASGGPGSDVTLFGSGLSATPTFLSFDFASDGFFGVADFVPGNTGFCVDGAQAPFSCGGDPPSLSFFATVGINEFVSVAERRTGVQLLASAVPEPSMWALMVAGIGLVGGTMRAHRPVRVGANLRLS